MRIKIPVGLSIDQVKNDFVNSERVLILFHYLLSKDVQHHHLHRMALDSTLETINHRVDAASLMKIFGRTKYRLVINWLKIKRMISIDEHFQFNATHKSLNHCKRYKIARRLVKHEEDTFFRYYTLTDKRSINAKKKLDEKIRCSHLRSISRLKNGDFLRKNILKLNLQELDVFDFESKVDDFGLRFHSQLTTLKKEDRWLLKLSDYDGDLYEIDIVSSQPFLLSQLTVNHLFKIIPKKEATQLSKHIEKLRATNDFKKFAQAINTNDIYKNWGDEVGISDRGQMKKLFFSTIYGTGFNRSELTKKFGNRFPKMMQCFKEIKSIRLAVNPSKKKHSNLSLLMQRFESYLCLEKVIDKAVEFGISDIVTIHDSWIVKKSDVKMMRFAVQQAFIEENIALPKLRITNLRNSTQFTA